MSSGFNKPPSNVSLSPLAQEVFAVLSRHTSFAWPALLAQCNRIGVKPGELNRQALRQLVPHLGQAVGRFTSPQTEAAVIEELRALL